MLLCVLQVINGPPHDRECCEEHIVSLVNECLIECLAAESIRKAEPKLSCHEQYILVKHVDDKV